MSDLSDRLDPLCGRLTGANDPKWVSSRLRCYMDEHYKNPIGGAARSYLFGRGKKEEFNRQRTSLSTNSPRRFAGARKHTLLPILPPYTRTHFTVIVSLHRGEKPRQPSNTILP